MQNETIIKIISDLNRLEKLYSQSGASKEAVWLKDCISRLFVLLTNQNYEKFSFQSSMQTVSVLCDDNSSCTVSIEELSRLSDEYQKLDTISDKQVTTMITGSDLKQLLTRPVSSYVTKSDKLEKEEDLAKNEAVNVPDVMTSQKSEPLETHNAVPDKPLQGENPHTDEDELCIAKQNLMIDIHQVSITDTQTKESLSFCAKVVPLEKKTDGSVPLLVYVEYNGKSSCYISSLSEDAPSSIQIPIEDCMFIVSGYWENNEFTSKVYVTGEFMQEPYKVEDSLDKKRPQDMSLGFLKEIKKNGELSIECCVVPLSIKNDITDSQTSCMLYLKKTNQTTREVEQTGGLLIQKPGDEKISALGLSVELQTYWEKNKFYSKIKIE